MTEGHDLHEAIVSQPFPPLDHMVVHHRDLRYRSTNVHEAEKEKVQEHLTPGRHLMTMTGCFFPATLLHFSSSLEFTSSGRASNALILCFVLAVLSHSIMSGD